MISGKGRTQDEPTQEKKMKIYKELSGCEILTIIIFGVILSFCDAVTDILQGTSLITNFRGRWESQMETIQYGIIVIIMCWVPGFVTLM